MFKKWYSVILIALVLSITSDFLTKIPVYAQDDLLYFNDNNRKVAMKQLLGQFTDNKGTPIDATEKSPVIDQTPTIDAANRIITVGESFDPLKGVTAFDSEDKDLTSRIEVIINDVDTTTPGTYDVTYKVVDSEGVETDLTIMVMVREIPQTGYSSFLIQGIILIIGSGLMINIRKRQSN